ncbi:hypothetical protein CAEBREN_30688 [Caenorhabditis brenneri]|uniref:Uncharacterized protein n=1 Tax=Caenorhabditis brenneri TaxID=135651 RepID=G0NUV4_CAEBE|nr:hypothetical protein CAEBREN_30688 [Caenorhabditis brenneri]
MGVVSLNPFQAVMDGTRGCRRRFRNIVLFRSEFLKKKCLDKENILISFQSVYSIYCGNPNHLMHYTKIQRSSFWLSAH